MAMFSQMEVGCTDEEVIDAQYAATTRRTPDSLKREPPCDMDGIATMESYGRCIIA